MPRHQAPAPAKKKPKEKPVQHRQQQTAPQPAALQTEIMPVTTAEWQSDFSQRDTALQRSMLENINALQGNRQAARLANTLQRHHGGDGEEEEEAVQRAEIIPETTRLATVDAAAAPLTLRENRSFFSPAVGQLDAGDSVRILEQGFFSAQVHVERGALRGRSGWTRLSGLTNTAEPTSNRTPNAGPEDAYARLQTALGAVPPVRNDILTIIDFHLTQSQRERLARTGNPEYAQILGLGAITAADFLNMCNLIGIRLHRKLSDYLTKGGSDYEAMRRAFASSTEPERLEVARDDALIGRLRPILRRTHPEIILGTVIIELYPANGRLSELRATNPELAAWLRPFARGNIRTSAERRAAGLQAALQAMTDRGAARARSTVMNALQAAPRGAALPGDERAALDQIEELAYASGAYTSNDLGIMFITRWGKPFRDASRKPRTFIHRIWSAFEPLPLDEVLLNNIIQSITENEDPTALGSFNDFLTNPAEFGRLRYNRPVAEALHADGAQRGRSIKVREPSLDLLTVGTQVTVADAGGALNTTVRGITVSTKTVRLANTVNLGDGGSITPTNAPANRSGAAQRISTRTALFADNGANAPDTTTTIGNIEPGNLFDQTATAVAGGVNYLGGTMYEGPFRNQFGWIAATALVALGGTTGQEEFDWTARHEIGHSLDTQLNGFSRFSAPSSARWIKYPGVADWVAHVIRDGPVANPDTNVVHNGVNANFRLAASVYSQAVQAGNATGANALLARNWLRGWRVAPGGSMAVYNVVTQFDANNFYYTQNNLGLPALAGRVYAAHYNEWYSAADAARNESIAAGVPTYAYTCNYEFFAEHYAAYTGPGSGGQRYARAVPAWAQNFFDRMVGVGGAGPQVGMERERMNR